MHQLRQEQQQHNNEHNKYSSAINNGTNNLTFKEKQVGNGHLENGSQESNKIKIERNETEKSMVKSKPKELDGYVGFANLPNQVYRKAVKKGFEFTLMVVGGYFSNPLNFLL